MQRGPSQAERNILHHGDNETQGPYDHDGAAGPAPERVVRQRVEKTWIKVRSWKRGEEKSNEQIEAELEQALIEERGGVDVSGLKMKGKQAAGWRLLAEDVGRYNEQKVERYACPMNYRCNCKTQVKIERTATEVILWVCNRHDEESHSEDRSKFLKTDQRSALARQVRANPAAAPRHIAAAIGNMNPSKKIDPAMQRSVHRYVKSQRQSLFETFVGGVRLDSTYGSLHMMCTTLMLVDLLAK